MVITGILSLVFLSIAIGVWASLFSARHKSNASISADIPSGGRVFQLRVIRNSAIEQFERGRRESVMLVELKSDKTTFDKVGEFLPAYSYGRSDVNWIMPISDFSFIDNKPSEELTNLNIFDQRFTGDSFNQLAKRLLDSRTAMESFLDGYARNFPDSYRNDTEYGLSYLVDMQRQKRAIQAPKMGLIYRSPTRTEIESFLIFRSPLYPQGSITLDTRELLELHANLNDWSSLDLNPNEPLEKLVANELERMKRSGSGVLADKLSGVWKARDTFKNKGNQTVEQYLAQRKSFMEKIGIQSAR